MSQLSESMYKMKKYFIVSISLRAESSQLQCQVLILMILSEQVDEGRRRCPPTDGVWVHDGSQV